MAFKDKAKTATTPSQSPPDPKPIGGLRKTSIDVGPAGTLTFSPANVTSLVGEILAFNFNPKNHSVTQSSFDKPCEPLMGDTGFSSGFVPTQVSPSGANFELEVKDTKPLWFYCAQVNGNHCQTGMVGSVNAYVLTMPVP
jgi:plastocyanin